MKSLFRASSGLWPVTAYSMTIRAGHLAVGIWIRITFENTIDNVSPISS